MGGHTIYPAEMKKLMDSLTPEQIKTLKKDNPFKRERDLLIRELAYRGVCYPLLAKASGLTKTSVHRIGTTGSNGRSSIQKQLVDMKRVRAAFAAFMEELKIILNTEEG